MGFTASRSHCANTTRLIDIETISPLPWIGQPVHICAFYCTIQFIPLYKLKANKNIHHGEILKAAVKESKHKVETITKKAGYSRSTYYNHIREPRLDWKVLERYGIAMQYDFTEDIPEMGKYVLQEPQGKYIPRTFEEAIRQYEQLRHKYDQLIEKFTLLSEEHNELHNKHDQARDEIMQLKIRKS